MRKYVGLLRGVNVAGKNQVPMAGLRALFESLGCTDVSTYVQSGNVIFTSAGRVTAKALEAAIEGNLGVATTVVLRTPAELRQVLDANPFPAADTSKLHVGFMAHLPSAPAAEGLDRARFLPEEFAVTRAEVYLHLPNGMGRAKLPAYLDRRLDVAMTVRNWNTVTKLADLTGG
ncbi:MAG TPA: DUF1697 domain-containing protein [Acidimicrobiales bacterium]|nr:DUF1697 domain-containing protein [Acidimicrobiales bacterium]